MKDIFYQHVEKKIGDGKNTRVWKDWLVDDKHLNDADPNLYFTSKDHNISVFDVIEKGWHNFYSLRPIM